MANDVIEKLALVVRHGVDRKILTLEDLSQLLSRLEALQGSARTESETAREQRRRQDDLL